MKIDTRDLTLLSLCLSWCFASILLFNELSLVVVALFLGLLSPRAKVCAITGLSIWTVANRWGATWGAVSTIPTGVAVVQKVDSLTPILLEESTNYGPLAYTIPLLMLLVIVGVPILKYKGDRPEWLLFLAATAASVGLGTFIFMGGPLFGVGPNQFIELLTSGDPVLATQHLGPLIAWGILFMHMIQVIATTILLYKLFERTGFYERIPGALPT